MNIKFKTWWEVVATLCSSAIVGLATGLTIPLVTLRLNNMGGIDTILIGIMAAMPAIGTFLIAPFTSKLTKWCCTKNLLLFALIGSALSILMLQSTLNIYFLFFLRLLMGIFCGILVVLGESYVNFIAKDAIRGRLIASYTTAFTACQVLGPSLLAWFGFNTWLPILVVCAMHLIAFMLLLLSKCDFTIQQIKSHLNVLNFIHRFPVIAIAVLVFAFFDSTILSMLPLYGLQYKFSAQLATIMVSVILIGDACLQIPLGWLVDFYNSAKMHFYCGISMLLFIILLPLLMIHPFILWPSLLILGATAGGIYTIALIRVGEIFKGQNLITANSSLALLWGIGSFLGPIITGIVISMIGIKGLIYTLAVLTFLFLLANLSQVWGVKANAH